ncbi:FecR domain-containing protein [Reichenbachiella sp.]|uniref:FecR family protein n=1 Tax=Reichenbachiella sp. TaxID=2184521 RepID=UPI0032990419
MSKDEIYNMIGKQLAGELSELENIHFEKWLGDSASNKNTYEVIQKSWQVPSEVKTKQMRGRLFDKIVDGIGREEFQHYPKNKAFPFRTLMKYAAVAALVTTISIGLWQIEDTTLPADQMPVTMIEKVNPKGQKSTIHLPDGSKVVLNAGSKLTYPQSFDASVREIRLEGEAYFDVARDEAHPFVVNAKNIAVQALGTAFNVNTRNEKIDVALTHGRVKVSVTKDNTKNVILEPGEMATYDKAGEQFSKATFSPDQVIAWKDGRLVFVDASLDEVISRLENWYGVEFEIADYHSHSWNYSSEFQNQRLSSVLKSIGFVQNFDYKIQGKKVTLIKKQ